ncbi:RNA 2',3'-cyclic phosphodiesterase [Sphingomonas immobilis]|uniref:RNA 2',3'-cyclic phosphodiesterase n=1 Tax=Sphingomonas immobilis TaxID=3063997 RepID=A0ABT9A1E9_9SPHN|nr:RNA 2',3'-cyclic phosphodiesterase [Sphingomonas sp. CA1-15]MDO7843646.1 RNA 2',3'-cyclic phosphodiesterase [Sphingomonas sp. CA1-15]
MHRLFVAVRPPRAIRATLEQAMGGVGAARWQNDDQLHLTIRYIGEVDRRMAEEIAIALGHVHGCAAEVAISGVGAFERRGHVDALWAGVTPHDALAALHRKVDHALVRIGLPAEGRAYLPHITLARLPRSVSPPEIAAWQAREAGLASPAFTFEHLILFESTLGGDGAAYETVARWPLT